MDTDDELFLDLIESVTLDVLERIGDDSAARYAFFKRFVGLAQQVVRDGATWKYVTVAPLTQTWSGGLCHIFLDL